MNNVRIASTFSLAVLAAATFVPGVPARAGVWNKLTTITVNKSIEVPGRVILQPGSYVFRLLDSQSQRNVVQILNTRQDHVFATILAISNYRMDPTDKTVLSFYEGPVGQPQMARAWFYPGDNFGQEFVYPKQRMDELRASMNVRPTPNAPLVAQNRPAPEPQPETPGPILAPTPAPAPEMAQNEPQIAQNEPPAQPEAIGPAPESAPAFVPQTLPQTASNLPLLALIGFSSLGAALGTRVLARRTNQ